MSNLKIIKNVIRVENIMCVYRNYSVLGAQRKCLIKIYILVMISAQLAACINAICESLTDLSKVNLTFVCFLLSYSGVSIVNNMAAIIMSCYHSALFQTFITKIVDISITYDNDTMYQELMKKLNNQFFKILLLWFGITIPLSVIYFINNFGYLYDKSIVIQGISDFILRIRYFWEILAFHLFIEILVTNMKYLNSSISAATMKLDEECEESLDKIEKVRGISEQLKKWGNMSGHLKVANDDLGRTFGLQILLSLWSSMLYHIDLLYYTITTALNKEAVYIARAGIAGYVLVLMAYFLTKLSVLWSGQRVRNEAQRLDAALARLRVRLLLIPGREAEACASAVARLARRLGAAPLRLRLLSARPLQMALLAEIVGVVADYTIVLLQFNHVV